MTARFKYTVVASTFVAIVAVGVGCAGPKSQAGGIGGAAAGGLVGGVVGGPEGLIAGALLGGLFGAAVGSALDERDRMLASQNAGWALEYAPSGTTQTWDNPDTGHSGSFTPVKTYRGPGGAYCREYQQTVIIGGRQEQAYGTACRGPDGAWQVQQP